MINTTITNEQDLDSRFEAPQHFKDNYVEITYMKEDEIVHMTIYEPFDSVTAAIDSNLKLLDFFRNFNTNKFSVDASKMGVQPDEFVKWLSENLFPPMIEHIGGRKLYHAQVIQSGEFEDQYSPNKVRLMSQIKSGFFNLKIKSFDELTAALDWLKGV